nr:MAG TPA: hypothetical protein [Caudoviricetes sp.]
MGQTILYNGLFKVVPAVVPPAAGIFHAPVTSIANAAEMSTIKLVKPYP